MKNNHLNTLKTLGLASSMLFLANCSTHSPHYVQDQMLTKAISLNMVLKENVPSKHISTHVGYGVVQAAGFVDNEEQLKLVSNILVQHKGQNHIINNVKILKSKDESKDESILRKSVLRELKEKKFPYKDIDAQARNGHVILSGFMNRHVDLNELSETVRQVPGIHKVDNYILYKNVMRA